MPEVEIQGITVTYRAKKDGEEVLYESLPQDEQVFHRIEYPFTDDDLVAIANKEHAYTGLQKSWVDREKTRMDYGNGVYVIIKSRLTYIPASYWGYINYWTLENGKKPDYREADRRFFLYKEYICFETQVLAVTRGKGRRKGATSQGAFWEWWICGRNEEKIGGIISFNDDAAQAVYQKMFMRGFTEMLPCFVEEFDSSSENFIRFVKPVEKKKKGVPIKREGLNSYVGFKSNAINSYDSGRVSYGLFDESGKYEKMDINTYWSKVSATLKEGLYKVGFAYLPTTVNPKKKGGENYKKFWNLCNQNAINLKTGEPYGLNTPNKAVRYFDPATEGYAGCIDKFGDSVIDDPIEPVMGNDGKWITRGSLSVIKAERALLDGEQLMEHRRDFPLDEYDMFSFETGQCEFIEANFVAQIQHLEDHPEEAYWRQVRMTETYNEKTKKIEVDFADDPKGEVWLKEKPSHPNKYSLLGNRLRPENTQMYSAGADTYRNIFAIDGSDGAITIFKKSHLVDGKETGLYPVCFFVGRPRLIKQFNRQAFLMCLWFGTKINYEIDAGTWFYEDFAEWNALDFLVWEPARDPIRHNKIIKPGTESAQPFQLAKQLEVAKLYFDGNRIDDYNGNVQRVSYIPLLREGLAYNHSERTPYHLMVSFMMALLPCLSSPPPPPPPARPRPILQTYKIKYS